MVGGKVPVAEKIDDAPAKNQGSPTQGDTPRWNWPKEIFRVLNRPENLLLLIASPIDFSFNVLYLSLN